VLEHDRTNNPSRAGRIIRLSRQPDHQCDSKIHSGRSKGRKQGGPTTLARYWLVSTGIAAVGIILAGGALLRNSK